MRLPCPTPWRAALAAILVLAAALPAQAQWKWRDKSGQITASDLPPPRDVAEKDILQRPADAAVRRPAPAAVTVDGAGSAASAPRAKPPVDKDLEAKRRAGEQEQQAKAKAEDEKLAQQRAENCRRARAHLQALDSGMRMARTNDKGEREILDDKQRADESRRANEVIASDCR